MNLVVFISLFKITISFSITSRNNLCYESFENYEEGFKGIDKNNNQLLEFNEYEKSCALPYSISQFQKIDKNGKGY